MQEVFWRTPKKILITNFRALGWDDHPKKKESEGEGKQKNPSQLGRDNHTTGTGETGIHFRTPEEQAARTAPRHNLVLVEVCWRRKNRNARGHSGFFPYGKYEDMGRIGAVLRRRGGGG